MTSLNVEDTTVMRLENARYYFDRQFEFQKSNKWILPQKPFTAAKFEVPELQDMKYQLNQVKGLLSQFNLNDWSKHTHNRDGSSFIMDYLKRRVKPEFMTQAWCKFYEIVSKFPIVPQKVGVGEYFQSLHLCEAPGAFICALNHYLVLNYPYLEWDWLANTLNPDYEGNPLSKMVPDDRLIRYTNDKWYFGLDFTGDIQKCYNHIDLVNIVNGKGKAKLVTADGSVDCMVDPGEQERLTEFLHYCETMTALAVLQTGGSFVLKIFTIFEDTTICLLYLLNCVFEKVTIFKPCSSKSGNSELYVICNSYNGFELLESIWDQLLIPYKMGHMDQNHSMFSISDIPNSFNIQILSCCSDFFAERQISVILDNIYYFQNPDKRDSNVHYRKRAIAELYIKKYRLAPIAKSRKIVPYVSVHRRVNRTYFDGLEGQNWNFCTVCKELGGFNEDCNELGGSSEEMLQIRLGKRMDVVYNSKFTSKENLEVINNMSKLVREWSSPQSLYSLVCKKISERNNVVLNGNDFDLSVYHKFQKQLFTKIKDIVDKENIEKSNIIFVNVPFYTYFLAGLWYILAQGFTNIYFQNGTAVLVAPIPVKLASVRDILIVIDDCYKNIKNEQFYCDIVQLLPKHVFDENLELVNMLHVINSVRTADVDKKLELVS